MSLDLDVTFSPNFKQINDCIKCLLRKWVVLEMMMMLMIEEWDGVVGVALLSLNT